MALNGMKVAVTGATGFIGRYICADLLAQGAEVVGVVRNPQRVPALAAAGVEMRRADLADRPALDAGFAGVDAVISNAALFNLSNSDWRAHEAANIHGGGNVLRAAAAAGVSRVVLVSSCGVYASIGRDTPSEAGEQFSPRTRRNRINRYMVSKALAEQDAWKIAAEHGLQLTAIRPSAVYGAHDPNFTPRMLKLARKPLAFPFLRFAFVYAGDVAGAISRCLADDQTIGKAYNTAGEDRGLGEFLDAIRSVYGLRKRKVQLPVPIVFRNTFSSALAARELGFSNRPLLEGLEETRQLESLGS